MKFGITTIDITPPFKTPMGGYAARQGLFDDVYDPVTCTALILENKSRRVLFVALDLVTLDDAQMPALRDRLASLADTVLENVLLNVSHTHGAPDPRSQGLYFLEERDTEASVRYWSWLEQKICTAVEIAMSQREEGSLWLGCGKTSVPMNRRLERDGAILNAPNPDGPIDDRLQLLALKDQAGTLRALGIRVSCHPVATGAQARITADFPGAFRSACTEEFGSNVTPFFLQGAGADTRPAAVANGDRWREMSHDNLPQIGRQLLDETRAVLNSDSMVELQNLELRGHFEYAHALCERQYTTEEDFKKLAASDVEMERLYAAHCLRELKAGRAIPDYLDIGVQTIWLTQDVAVVGIQGEVLLGLGDYVEQTFPRSGKTLLLGYCNGVLAYFPDTQEMRRGGYEKTSYLHAGWTGPLKEGLEKTIAEAVQNEFGKQKI